MMGLSEEEIMHTVDGIDYSICRTVEGWLDEHCGVCGKVIKSKTLWVGNWGKKFLCHACYRTKKARR